MVHAAFWSGSGVVDIRTLPAFADSKAGWTNTNPIPKLLLKVFVKRLLT